MRLVILQQVLFAVAHAQWAANVEVETRSLDEIYQAAQQEEGPLVVASGGDAQSQGNGIRNAWAARFPNIALNLTVDLSKYHDSRIDREFYEGRPTTDIAMLQTLHDFPRWKEQNRLLYYKPATFDNIYNGEKDLDGAHLPVLAISFGHFIYDNTKLNGSAIPTSYEELTEPAWRGKLVLTYPNDDDAILYLFSIIVQKHGFQWLDKLALNNVHWVRGSATPVYYLTQNHANSSYTPVLTFTSSGAGNSSFLASSEPAVPEQKMSWLQNIGIFSSTKRPESAKLFVNWLLGEDFQRNLGTPGPLRSLDYNSQTPLYGSNITQTSGFRLFMNDRRQVDWWKLQFETTLGSAQGPTPLSIVP